MRQLWQRVDLVHVWPNMHMLAHRKLSLSCRGLQVDRRVHAHGTISALERPSRRIFRCRALVWNKSEASTGGCKLTQTSAWPVGRADLSELYTSVSVSHHSRNDIGLRFAIQKIAFSINMRKARRFAIFYAGRISKLISIGILHRRNPIQHVLDRLKSCQSALLHAEQKLTVLDCKASDLPELDNYM